MCPFEKRHFLTWNDLNPRLGRNWDIFLKKFSNGTFKTLQSKVFGSKKNSNSVQGIKSAKSEITNLALLIPCMLKKCYLQKVRMYWEHSWLNRKKILERAVKVKFCFWKSNERLHYFWKNASAGAGEIIKYWGAVQKCVRINYQNAGVRAPHSKMYRNPTSVI